MASCSSSVVEERLPPVSIPPGWKRLVAKGKVTYVSPSEFRLHSLSEVACYLQTEGTCKCGLQCPLVLGTAFDFRPAVPNAPYRSTTPNSQRSLCRHAPTARKVAEPRRKRVRGRYESALVSQLLAQRDKTGRKVWDNYDSKVLQSCATDNGISMFGKHSPLESVKKTEAVYTERVPPLPFGSQQFLHSPNVNFVNVEDNKISCNFASTSSFGPPVNSQNNPGAFLYPQDPNNPQAAMLRQQQMQNNMTNFLNPSCGPGFYTHLQDTQFPIVSSASGNGSPRFPIEGPVAGRQKTSKKGSKVKLNKLNSVLDRGPPCPNIDVRQIPPEHHRPPLEAFATTSVSYAGGNMPFSQDLSYLNKSFVPCVPGRTNAQPYFDPSKSHESNGSGSPFLPCQNINRTVQDMSQLHNVYPSIESSRNHGKVMLSGKVPSYQQIPCSIPQVNSLGRLQSSDSRMQENYIQGREMKNSPCFDNTIKVSVGPDTKPPDNVNMYSNISNNTCPTSAIVSVAITSNAINATANSMSITPSSMMGSTMSITPNSIMNSNMSINPNNISIAPNGMHFGSGNFNVAPNCINVTSSNMNVASNNMNVLPNGLNIAQNSIHVAQNGMNVPQSNMNLSQNPMNIAQNSMGIPQNSLNVGQNSMGIIQNNMNVAPGNMNVVPNNMGVPSNNMGSQSFYNVSTQSNVINIPVSYAQSPVGNIYSNPQQPLLYSDTSNNNGRQEFYLQDVQQDGMLQVLSQNFSSRAQVVQQVSVLPGNNGGQLLLTPTRAITMLPSPQQPPLLQSFIVARPQEQKENSFQKAEEEGGNNEVGQFLSGRASSVPSNMNMMPNCGQVLINNDGSQASNLPRMILNSPMPPMSVPNVTSVTTSVTQMIPALGLTPQILGQQPMVQVINTMPFNSMQNAVIVPGGANMMNFGGVVLPQNCVPPPSTSQPSPGVFIPQNTMNCIQPPVTSQAPSFNGVVLPPNTMNCISSPMPPNSVNCIQPNTMNCLQPNTLNCMQANTLNCIQSNTMNCVQSPANSMNCIQQSPMNCIQSQSPASLRGDDSSCSASSSTPVTTEALRAMSPAVRKRNRDGKRKANSQTVASMLQHSSSSQQMKMQQQAELQQSFLQPPAMQLQALTVRPLLQQPMVNYGGMNQILTTAGPLGLVQPLAVLHPFPQLAVLQDPPPVSQPPVQSAFGGAMVPSQPPVAQSLSATRPSPVAVSSSSRCSIGVQSEQTSPDSTRLKTESSGGGESSREWWPDPLNLSAAVRAVVQEQVDSNDCLPGIEEPDSASEVPMMRDEAYQGGGGGDRNFREGDVVWGSVRGCPSWPGKLVAPTHPNGNKLWVRWFGEAGGLSQVDADQLKTLSEGLEAHHKARKRHRRGRKMNTQLENAIQEAMMELDRHAPSAS